MDIQRTLKEEIVTEFESLKKMKLGTEEYKTTVDGLTKLVDRAIEMDKFDAEFANKLQEQEIAGNWKVEQMKEEKKDRRFKNGIAIAGIAVPAAVTIWGALKSWEFEKNDTVTSLMGRLFMNGLVKKH